MSKRNGDKARTNRQHQAKLLQRKHSRELEKPLEHVTTEANQNKDGNPVASSRLRQLAVNGKSDPTALEIVVSKSSPEGQND
ncbi:MAG: hypothetical protein ABIU20_03550 [Blastocatellia bacterium]